ncbi:MULTISPECIES: DUF3047 domain-containing protein [Vibrio]|uniref:DUF3047 domain-containing protein n=1 Tax=Vibrio halioticoli NBRC 102217 TaxID=1219072 RepID=V5FDK5_9VIBR|nr:MULTISPECIES: DUF3047 domain-containing protein [Vibrio]MPW37375.1 DUF3047 domain-containing protein [Vibrio sp. B1Z05]GAD89723.1 hypothetical protein VHA01S_026_00290 [Vibrio halioticoli NBRC 102217]
MIKYKCYVKHVLLLLLILNSSNVLADSSINLTDIANNGIQNWHTKTLSGITRYDVTEYLAQPAIIANSDNSASGLILKKRIDLLATPFMNWSWAIKTPLSKLDETKKDGDDFAARIYVVIDGGMMFWNTQSISYVWSSAQEKGQIWDNPFAGSHVKMLSLQDKSSNIGPWYQQKRNIYQDLVAVFGDKGSKKANQKSYRYIDMVAIMTDTDNSGGHAEAYYGDIVFSSW